MLGSDWRQLFKYVIVQARKPAFFQNSTAPFRLYHVDNQRLSYEKVTQLAPYTVYSGVCQDFTSRPGL